MKSNFWFGFFVGAIGGGVGSILVNQFDFSLVSAGISGGLIGVAFAFVYGYFKK